MNNQNREVFIIDSNALITPYKSYYSKGILTYG